MVHAEPSERQSRACSFRDLMGCRVVTRRLRAHGLKPAALTFGGSHSTCEWRPCDSPHMCLSRLHPDPQSRQAECPGGGSPCPRLPQQGMRPAPSRNVQSRARSVESRPRSLSLSVGCDHTVCVGLRPSTSTGHHLLLRQTREVLLALLLGMHCSEVSAGARRVSEKRVSLCRPCVFTYLSTQGHFSVRFWSRWWIQWDVGIESRSKCSQN